MRIGAGRFKGRRLPAARSARPVGARLKTSLFSVLAGRLEGARVLDLFAGAGGFGLEALSRGARCAVFVERDRTACRALRRWLEEAGAAGEAEVLCRALERGAWPAGPFDVVFLDPPFQAWSGPEGVALLERALATLAPEGVVVVKLPARARLPEDSGRRLLRRTAVSSAAYAIFAAAGPRSGGADDQAGGRAGRL